MHVRRCPAVRVGPVVTPLAHKSTSFTPTTTPPAAPSSSPSPPTSEDYRALLLDLLLYRRETLSPLLTALQQERAELEAKMTLLEAHVKELREIRDELRCLAEGKLDEEHRKLHAAVFAAPANAKGANTRSAATPPGHAESPDDDEIVL